MISFRESLSLAGRMLGGAFVGAGCALVGSVVLFLPMFVSGGGLDSWEFLVALGIGSLIGATAAMNAGNGRSSNKQDPPELAAAPRLDDPFYSTIGRDAPRTSTDEVTPPPRA